jgi:hypothetical protein
VCLVHDQQRHTGLGQAIDDLVVGQLLRRQEDEFRVAGAQRLPGLMGLARTLGRVHRHGGQTGSIPTCREPRQLISL